MQPAPLNINIYTYLSDQGCSWKVGDQNWMLGNSWFSFQLQHTILICKINMQNETKNIIFQEIICQEFCFLSGKIYKSKSSVDKYVNVYHVSINYNTQTYTGWTLRIFLLIQIFQIWFKIFTQKNCYCHLLFLFSLTHVT